MIAYEMWYVAIDEVHGSSGAHHGGILQGSPCIHLEDFRVEETKESSADDTGSSHRIRACFPRDSGQLL